MRMRWGALALLLLGWPVGGWPAEQRCDELGANCICSEPLNTSAYTYGAETLNPSDSVTKQCDVYGGTEGWTSDTNIIGEKFPTNAAGSPTMFAALPAGHSVSWVLRAIENHMGVWHLGHWISDDDLYTKRVAMRWYVYHSPNASFVDITNQSGGCAGGACGCNNKLIDLENGWLIHAPYEWTHFTLFVDWTIDSFPNGFDCCTNGPGAHMMHQNSKTLCTATPYGCDPNGAGPDDGETWKGKWWRIEVVMTNRNAGTTHQLWGMLVYAKNVTDDHDEQLIMDTTADFGPLYTKNNNTVPSVLYPNTLPIFRRFVTNLWRGSNYTGHCTGFKAISHYMLAGWDTDAGQRIGAAYEVEAGGGPPPSNPPIATLVARIASWLLVIAPVVGAAAYLVRRRRRFHAAPHRDPDDFRDVPVEPVPVDGPPAPPRHAVQPVVSPTPEHELVGAGREMEGRR